MKKVLSVLVAISMLLTLMAAFGGGAALASEESITLTYWSMWNDSENQADVLRDMISRFENDHPNIKVNVNWAGREVRKIAQPALAAGQEIDIIEYDPRFLILNMEDWLLPLDDYINASYDILGGQTVKERCVPVLWEYILSASKSGALYAIPSSPCVLAIFYNKAHFRAAGIESTPATWEEFLEVCDKLKAAGFTPFTNDDSYMNMWYDNYMQSAKGDAWIAEATFDKTGEYWKDPAVAQMAQDFDELRAKGYISPNTANNISPAGQQTVGLGETSMFYNGSWFPNEMMPLAGPDFEWGCFPWPTVANSVQPSTVTWIGSQGFTISKASKHPDEAFALLTYVNADQTEQDLAEKTFTLPAVLSIAPPSILEDASAILASSTDFFKHYLPDNADLGPVLQTNFTKLIGGTLTPEQFVDEMVKAAQSY